MGLLDMIKGEFIDVIEWVDDTPDTLVYRFPVYNKLIQMGSSLIVRESQMAVFVYKGKIADVYTPGNYTLTTENMPIMTTLQYWKTGFNSPFKCDVYFFNTRQFVDLKWGTPNVVNVRDSEFGALAIRAFGIYAMRIKDPQKMMLEISGTADVFPVSRIEGQLRQLIITKFSDFFAGSKVSFIDCAAHLNEFSQTMKPLLDQEFADLGFELTKFIVENVSVPPEVQSVIDKKAGMKFVGSDIDAYTKFQVGDSVKDAANNPGGAAGAGVGAGMGFMMGQKLMDGMKSGEGDKQKIMVRCPNCDKLNEETAKFCSECGTALTKKK
jgi:membrane protease subunit (stomatin/prohibitin family)